MSKRENRSNLKCAANAESDRLEMLIGTILPAILLIAVVVVVSIIRASIRRLLDLCIRGLDDGRISDPWEVRTNQPHRPAANTDFEEQLSIVSQSGVDEAVTRQQRVREWQKSFPLRSRSGLVPEMQGRRFHPYQRHASVRSASMGKKVQEYNTSPSGSSSRRPKPQYREVEDSSTRNASKGVKEHNKNTYLPDLLGHLPESHRPEANQLYSGLRISMADRLIKQASKRRSEIPAQSQRVTVERNDEEEEPLDSWREIGIMTDGWEDFQAPDTSDEESAQEELDESHRPRVQLMRALNVASVDRLEQANTQPTLRRRASPQARRRGTGRDDSHCKDPQEDFNDVHLRGGGGDDFEGRGLRNDFTLRHYDHDKADEDEDSDEDLYIQGLSDQLDPFDNDDTGGLQRYPTNPRTSSTSSDREDALQTRTRAVFGGPLPLDAHRSEIIEDADRATSMSGPEEMSAPGSSTPDPIRPGRTRKVFSGEVADECNDIMGDLDSAYQHLELVRRKFSQLLQRANTTDKPLLRHIILSNNELQAREAEHTNLREYVARMSVTAKAPDDELFAYVLDHIEQEDRRMNVRDHVSASAHGAAVRLPNRPPRPTRSWGWRPKARATRRRTRSRNVEDSVEGRRYVPSGLSQAVPAPREPTSSCDGGDIPSYRSPRAHTRPLTPTPELDGTQTPR